MSKLIDHYKFGCTLSNLVCKNACINSTLPLRFEDHWSFQLASFRSFSRKLTFLAILVYCITILELLGKKHNFFACRTFIPKGWRPWWRLQAFCFQATYFGTSQRRV